MSTTIDLSKMATLLEDTGLEIRIVLQYADALTHQLSTGDISDECLNESLNDLFLIAHRLNDCFKKLDAEYANSLRPILAELNRTQEQTTVTDLVV